MISVTSVQRTEQRYDRAASGLRLRELVLRESRKRSASTTSVKLMSGPS
jgi:hypothetical protein